MTNDNTQIDRQLLLDQPEELLKQYQSLIKAVVASFFRRGFFAGAEQTEIVQEVNLILLESKLQKIAERFDGSVQLKTYFSKVVINICHDLLRKRKRQAILLPEEKLLHQADRSISGLDRLLLQDECYRLEALLRLLPRRFRSLICLKAWARIVFRSADIQYYLVPAAQKILPQLKLFFQQYDQLRDPQVYAPLAELFSLTEKKEIAPDSLRRWTNMRVDRLVEDLNGTPPQAGYTPALLKILLRYYFENVNLFSERKNK